MSWVIVYSGFDGSIDIHENTIRRVIATRRIPASI
jgi:hypothetical protein